MDNQLEKTIAQVFLTIIETGEVINLISPGEFTIGRGNQEQRDTGQDQSEAHKPVEIDLSAYNAYETGVSRHHAQLIIQDTQATLTDLGSTNGTRLNGNLLRPFVPQYLKNEDIITLGKLKILIHISLA